MITTIRLDSVDIAKAREQAAELYQKMIIHEALRDVEEKRSLP